LRILVIAPVVFPVTPYAHYQGIERLVRCWVSELNLRGHKVSVVAAEGSAFPRGVNWIRVPQGDFVQGEVVAYGHYRHLVRDYDLILDFSHSHCAMREEDLPAVCWVWHSPALMQPPLPGYNVCALSHYQAAQLFAYQSVRARVVDPHCGVPVDPSESSGRYLFIGRLHPTKGAGEAARLCLEVGVPLDIIGGLGPGDTPEMMAEVMKLCGDGIAYQGEVGDDVKNVFLSSSRALLFPIDSLYEEAHSHKTVDALLAGLPVVTYARGALPEIVDHGVDGFLAMSREEFKSYMLQVDTLDRQAIRQRAVERWGIPQAVDRAWPVLQQVARGLRW
jgi:glycosyltransferase involved in cell wall biosynthesis